MGSGLRHGVRDGSGTLLDKAGKEEAGAPEEVVRVRPCIRHAVTALKTDVAELSGVDELYAVIGGCEVDAPLANAGHGLGKGFLDQDFDDVRHVIDTNLTGAIYLSRRSVT